MQLNLALKELFFLRVGKLTPDPVEAILIA
jgi:hypothetical protein